MKKISHNAWEQSLEVLKKQILAQLLITHPLLLDRAYDAVEIIADKTELFHKIMTKSIL